MFLALKEMKKEKGRFILIISIVFLISYLVFFLTGLSYGLSRANRSAVDFWNGDRIVLQKGTNKNILSSVLEKSDKDDFKSHKISPINISAAIAFKNKDKNEDTTYDIFMVGFDKNSKNIAPIVEGRNIEDYDKEVIASISIKEEEGFKLNDKILLSQNEKEYEIVGFTEESKFSVRPVFYTSLENASKEMMGFKESKENKDSSKADAKTEATQNPPERIAGILIDDNKEIKDNEKYDVLSKDDFIENLPGYKAQNLTFILMIGFLILIAAIVLGVFIYIITMQKKEIFGVLKIQGISNYYIGKSVILQTLLISFIGIVLGLLLTYISEKFLPAKVPFESNWIFYLYISILILLFTLLGGLFSVFSVSKVEALEVLE